MHEKIEWIQYTEIPEVLWMKHVIFVVRETWKDGLSLIQYPILTR